MIMTSVSQKIIQNYGIEVNAGIQWQGWEPGGEYTKQITLKNVQVKTQKIIYKWVYCIEYKIIHICV